VRFLALLSLLAVSCSSLPMPDPVTVDPSVADPRLRAHLSFKADGVSFVGVGLLPRRPGSGTKFQVVLPKDTRIIFVNTCAREETYETPKGDVFEYQYNAGMFKENIGSCMLIITVITKGGEYHRAIADFTNSKGRDLPADVFCNGQWISTKEGAGICQVRASLPASVRFKEPVIYSHRPECAVPVCVSGCKTVNEVVIGTEFDIRTTEGFCGYGFNSRSNLDFRFTTVGYTSVLNLFPPLKGR
jgi:hypothetical protein